MKKAELEALIAELEGIEPMYRDAGLPGWTLFERELTALRDYAALQDAVEQIEALAVDHVGEFEFDVLAGIATLSGAALSATAAPEAQ